MKGAQMRNRVIPVLAAVLVVSAGAFGGDWPRFLGPDANGISSEKGINKNWNEKKPAEVWKFKLSDGGYAGPSVADGKVFIIDRQGDNDVVRALNLADGKPVWEATYAEPGKPDEGNFARSTPTFDNGKLYTLSRGGLVNCYDAKDGKKIWSRSLPADFKGDQPQWFWSMSPVIDGNNVILVPGGPEAGVAALNKETGQTVWQGSGGQGKPGYATPVIATIGGKKQYLVFMSKSVIGVDAENGKMLWSFPWETKYDVNAAMPLAIGDDMVFITSNYGRGGAVLKIAGDKVEKVWENKEIQSHFSTPILHEGKIYAGTDPGNLVCLDPKTGKSLWRHGGFQKGGIVIVDGTIIAMNGKDGDLIMAELKPDAYKELGRLKPLGGQSWTAPILANGKLIIRNKQELGCYDLK